MKRRKPLILLFFLSFVLISGLFFWSQAGRLRQWRRGPQVIFLAPDENERYQLFMVDPKGPAAPRRLASTPAGIMDFAPSPDGRNIALIGERPDGDPDLVLFDVWGNQMKVLVACVDFACRNPVWAPDGRRIIYERWPGVDSSPLDARLWWVDIETHQTVPLFDDPGLTGLGGSFSPDGGWLAFAVPAEEAVRLYNIETGETFSLHSRTGEAPIWGPDGSIVYTNFKLREEMLLTHLYRYQVDGRTFADLSGVNALVIDSFAEWSAASQRIVFTRRPARALLGGQLWIMDADGGDARSLTSEIEAHYGAPAWSPDGQQIAFQRFNPGDPAAEPEIWLYDLPTNRATFLARPGSQPRWMP